MIWRPLLSLDKKDILDYAHSIQVHAPSFFRFDLLPEIRNANPLADLPTFVALQSTPYFKDTTPTWSTRGKTRNQLIPLLQEIYGQGLLRELSGLAEQSTQLEELFGTLLLNPFREKVQISSIQKFQGDGPGLQRLIRLTSDQSGELSSSRSSGVCVFFDVRPWKDQPLIFWSEVSLLTLSLSFAFDYSIGEESWTRWTVFFPIQALRHVLHKIMGVGESLPRGRDFHLTPFPPQLIDVLCTSVVSCLHTLQGWFGGADCRLSWTRYRRPLLALKSQSRPTGNSLPQPHHANLFVLSRKLRVKSERPQRVHRTAVSPCCVPLWLLPGDFISLVPSFTGRGEIRITSHESYGGRGSP